VVALDEQHVEQRLAPRLEFGRCVLDDHRSSDGGDACGGRPAVGGHRAEAALAARGQIFAVAEAGNVHAARIGGGDDRLARPRIECDTVDRETQ
jgi:hypothetical protein